MADLGDQAYVDQDLLYQLHIYLPTLEHMWPSLRPGTTAEPRAVVCSQVEIGESAIEFGARRGCEPIFWSESTTWAEDEGNEEMDKTGKMG